MTQDYLKEWMFYDRDTGIFTRRKKKPNGGKRNNIGDKQGSKEVNGYWAMSIDGKRYKLHRLAWLYEYGSFPEGQIDHIDRDKNNNAISNLRDVTRRINMRNRNKLSTNTSGRSGVYFRKDRGYWEASLYITNEKGDIISKKKKGNSFDEACKIRDKWEVEFGYMFSIEYQPKG